MSIDGAIKAGSTGGLFLTSFTPGMDGAVANDGYGALDLSDLVFRVEEVAFDSKNEDFQTASIKLCAYPLITGELTALS